MPTSWSPAVTPPAVAMWLGQPEVGEVDVLVGALDGDQRVAGLDVAMGQAPRMRGVERVRRAARPARPRAAAPSDPRGAAASRGRCPRRSASRCTAGRRSRRPRRSARCRRDRSTRPAATPPGTASGSERPRSGARPAASAPPCGPDAGPRRDTPRPCRRDRGAPRSGNSPDWVPMLGAGMVPRPSWRGAPSIRPRVTCPGA